MQDQNYANVIYDESMFITGNSNISFSRMDRSSRQTKSEAWRNCITRSTNKIIAVNVSSHLPSRGYMFVMWLSQKRCPFVNHGEKLSRDFQATESVKRSLKTSYCLKTKKNSRKIFGSKQNKKWDHKLPRKQPGGNLIPNVVGTAELRTAYSSDHFVIKEEILKIKELRKDNIKKSPEGIRKGKTK